MRFLLLSTLLIGCARSGAPSLETEARATLSADRQATPASYAVLASADYPVRHVDDLTATRAKLASDTALSPTVAALRAGGWTDEEIAKMVTTAAAFNSGQPSDPVRARGAAFRAGVQTALDAVDAKLKENEQRTGQKVDRQKLATDLFAPTGVLK